MEFDLLHLWASMNNLVRMVVIVLTIQALKGIYVFVDRLLLLFISSRRSKAFAIEAGPMLMEGRHADALEIAKKHDKSHLANFIEMGISTFLTRKNTGNSREKSAVFAKRALERKGENLSEHLNRGLSSLATTGSTAPFVGLLGTVLGILQAFKAIGEDASGGMGTIGPMIAEALIVTGYGLLVAIPSVFVFNYLSGRIAQYEAGLANAGSELIDELEAGTLVAGRGVAFATAHESEDEISGASGLGQSMSGSAFVPVAEE